MPSSFDDDQARRSCQVRPAGLAYGDALVSGRTDAIPRWRAPSRTSRCTRIEPIGGIESSLLGGLPIVGCTLTDWIGLGAHVVARESSEALVSGIEMSRGNVTHTISTPRPHKLLLVKSRREGEKTRVSLILCEMLRKNADIGDSEREGFEPSRGESRAVA
jgi:hypothetical protein